MPVLNLPPGMTGAQPPGPPMAGGMAGPNPMAAALASVLMPRQAEFPTPRDLRIPRPGHKKAKGKMGAATKAAVKAKAARAIAHL